ncbi:hypothetical protein JCM8097_008116 [Rhodosporidiobolus ruineniae]
MAEVASGEERTPEPSDDDQGVDLRPGAGSPNDSSEEEATDSEEEREVRKGFIVDESESRRRRRKKKRSKRRAEGGEGGEGGEEGDEGRESRKRRKDSDDEGDLDEDDLELLQENLGLERPSKSKNKLKRLRRRQRSGSADSSAPRGGDLEDIFNDDDGRDRASSSRKGGRGGDRGVEALFDADEMAGFIEDDTDEDDEDRRGGGSSDEDEDEDSRRRRRERKKRERREQAKQRRSMGMGRVEGITAEAWSEVAEVFGDGQDYAWAMGDEDEEGEADKPKELKDIFEPSEIASRMLTEEDEKIRTTDVPERMQLNNVGLPPFTLSETGDLVPLIPESEIRKAAFWMSDKVSREATARFVLKDEAGNPPDLANEFLTALEHVVKFINVEFLEPPHIAYHRADYLFHAPSGTDPVPLLGERDVWRVAQLSVKYRAFLARRNDVVGLWRNLGVIDAEVDEVLDGLQTVEEAADAQAWIGMRWSDRVRDVKKAKKEAGEEGGDGDDQPGEGDGAAAGGVRRPKRANRDNDYERAKASAIRNFADQIAIPPTSLAVDVAQQTKTHFVDADPAQTPLDLADTFVDGSSYPTRESALAAAKLVLTTEIGAEPLLRKEVRRFFRDFAVVDVEATKAGESKIDQMNPFYAFKYLKAKPVLEFTRSPQWLQILSAESEGLVTSSIYLPQGAYDQLFGSFRAMYLTDFTSALADEWNELRTEILREAIDGALLKEGAAWARGWLKEESEELVMAMCRGMLERRIDVAPWQREDGTMERGQTPSVLALSNGNGDPRRDSVMAVYIDADGHFREHLSIDRIGDDMDPAQRESLEELLRRRRPQVCVVGGFRPGTTALMTEFRRFADQVAQKLFDEDDELIQDEDDNTDQSIGEAERDRRRRNRATFESTYVYDDVARIYQNSARAQQEFSELPTLGKYCVGLARYIQSPLNEYAALGGDLGALTYDPNQKFLPKEKVNQALERALIEVTNRVGVDINKAVRNQYYAHLLPYVSGLGPRKADAVIKKINAKGGTLSTRSGLVIDQIMTKNIWVNASAFLRIRQDDLAADLGRDTENDQELDVLDETRIHPEDYDVARKMAADAMEYDEEDLEGAPPSKAVADLFEDDTAKLNELALDEFAEELSKVLQQPKRLTLYRIREELQRPFGERRHQFSAPTEQELFTMFTGETKQTLDPGLIIPVRVLRVDPTEAVIVRLDCGIEGHISAEFRTESQTYTKLRQGQTLQAAVMDVRYRDMKVDLTTNESVIAAGDAARRQTRPDTWFDHAKAEAAQRAAGQEKQKQVGGRVKRRIDHPNFQDISSGKAEEYLSNMQRGDCVIRPSSKEDHLAVTWKVDDGLYQHIAVHELNKPNEYSLGTQLRISNQHRYSDLDELIDAHIKQMARRVNEITNHDRFKGKKEQLDKFLQNFTLANPGRSMYAFGWDEDRRKPGQIVLGFKVNEKSPISSMGVTIVPEGFRLQGQVHGDVQSLCNAFKTVYAASMAGGARLNPNVGGRTPFPGQPQPGRTPNPALARTGLTPYGAGGAYPQGAGGAARGPSGMTPNPMYNGGKTPVHAFGGQQQLPSAALAAQQAMGARTPGGSMYAGGRTPAGGAGGRTPYGGGAGGYGGGGYGGGGNGYGGGY